MKSNRQRLTFSRVDSSIDIGKNWENYIREEEK